MSSHFFRVTWKDEYFLEELLYAKEDMLLEAKNVEIYVQTLDTETKICNQNQNEYKDANDGIKESDEEKPLRFAGLKESDALILDIDLDFFSTYNPFKLNFSEVRQILSMKKAWMTKLMSIARHKISSWKDFQPSKS